MFRPRYEIDPDLLHYLKRIAVVSHQIEEFKPRPRFDYSEWRRALLHELTIEGMAFDFTGESLHFLYQDVIASLNVTPEEVGYRTSHLPSLRLRDDLTYVPPPPDAVPGLMQDLFAFIEEASDLDYVVLAGLFCMQFLLVQPFAHANTRMAHYASTALIRGASHRLGDHADIDYETVTRLFDDVQFPGEEVDYADAAIDFTPGLVLLADDMLRKLTRARDHRPTAHLGPHHRAVVRYLTEHGSITDREYATLVDRAKSTRYLDLRYLLQNGVITRHGRGPATYYRLR